jgi:hypothetical protein
MMAEKIKKWLKPALLLVLLTITLKCFSLLLGQHISLLNHPYQVEMREGASLNLTKVLAEGKNPYLLENQPWYADNFGIIYPLSALPFTKIFGMNLFSLRLTSAIAIFLSMLLVFVALLRNNVGWICSFAGVVIFYGCVLYYVTPICRADSVGMLFFLSGVIIPVIFRFSNVSLFLGGLFAILAFYTKQYGILGFPVILSYLFLFVSIRKALVNALIFLSILFLSMWIVSEFLPCYFYNTTISMAIATDNSFAYSFYQMRLLFGRYLPGLSILALAILIFHVYGHRLDFIQNGKIKAMFKLNVKEPSKGILSLNVDPYIWVFFVFFGLLLFKLGGNGGTFMTYHFQLLVFSWIIVIISRASVIQDINWLWLKIPALGYAVYTATLLITSTGHFKSEYKIGWEKAKQLINEHQHILNDPSLTAEMIYAGRQVYNSGLTEYFFRAALNDDLNQMIPFTRKLNKKAVDFKSLVRDNVKNKRFDLLMLTDLCWIVHGAPVEENYIKSDSLYLNMYYTSQDWTIYVWRPKVANI